MWMVQSDCSYYAKATTFSSIFDIRVKFYRWVSQQPPNSRIIAYQMPPKLKFAEGERVLCFHGPLIYEAKCMKGQVKEKTPRYLIHYNGWNKNWDEWVPENRVLKFNEANLQKQRELREQMYVCIALGNGLYVWCDCLEDIEGVVVVRRLSDIIPHCKWLQRYLPLHVELVCLGDHKSIWWHSFLESFHFLFYILFWSIKLYFKVIVVVS